MRQTLLRGLEPRIGRTRHALAASIRRNVAGSGPGRAGGLSHSPAGAGTTTSSCRGRRGGHAARAGVASSSADAETAEDIDPLLALALAGHAFFAYKEPTCCIRKDVVGTDTDVWLLCRNYMLKEYAGCLAIDSNSVRFAGGENLKDVFFALSIGDDIHNTGTCERAEDGAHFCGERHEFLLKSSRGQNLQIRVWRKRFLRPDELLGVSIVPFDKFSRLNGETQTFPLRGGSMEGELSASLAYTNFEDVEDEQEHTSQMVLDLIGIDGTSMPLLNMKFRPCCFINNRETDTQAWVWWNQEDREVIFAFRGTEQTQWKDLLTDVKVLPTSVNAEGVTDIHLFANDSEVMVHNGFLTAYLSVRSALLGQLKQICGTNGGSAAEPWTIYVTGHSLGGALATIFAYDCSDLNLGDVQMYNFGSPRVGTKKFAEEFAKKVNSSWRFSNTSDIIPTVPRFLGYRHVDRSVQIDEGGKIQVLQDKDVLGETHFSEILAVEDSEVEEILQKELRLLSTLIDGRALQEHMENNYLSNLLTVVSALRKDV